MDNINAPQNDKPLQGSGQPPYNQTAAPQYQPGGYQAYVVTGGAPKKKRWIWFAGGAFLIVAAIVIAVILLAGRGEAKGNKGVWAVYDYYKQIQEKQEQMAGRTQKELTARMLAEPFEIDAEIEVCSDEIEQLGLPIPLDSITLDLAAKYDMKDFGIKLGALGMFEFGAYLIEDEIVLELLGEAASLPIELPIKADLGDKMTLEKRAKAFLPFLPEDDEMFMRLLEKFAMAVPDKYTKTGEKRVYSPMEDKKVKMDVITTTLDGKAIKEIVENLEKSMKQDEELSDELQDFLDDITKFFDLEKVDFQDGLEELNDMIQKEDLDEIEFSWSVYQREGSYTGMSIEIEFDSNNFEMILMSEYSKDEAAAFSQIFVGGEETQSQKVMSAWDEDKIEYESEIIMVNDTFYGKQKTTTFIDGESEISKDDNDEYAVIMDLDVDVKTETENSEEDFSVELGIKADCFVGKELEMLEESRDWEDIYDKEWGEIEDIFQNLEFFGGLM